ncbi:MAG: hypothetical protein ACRC6M_03035 [Microcystaceae cyanobacterium]
MMPTLWLNNVNSGRFKRSLINLTSRNAIAVKIQEREAIAFLSELFFFVTK